MVPIWIRESSSSEPYRLVISRRLKCLSSTHISACSVFLSVHPSLLASLTAPAPTLLSVFFSSTTTSPSENTHKVYTAASRGVGGCLQIWHWLHLALSSPLLYSSVPAFGFPLVIWAE